MSRSCTRILYTNSFSMVLVSPSKFAYFRTSAMNLSAEISSFSYPAFFRGHQRVGTPEYLSMMRLRKIWAEGSFSVLKREHCISKIRKRGILAATEECLLAAMALNLKRMAKCHLSLSPNLLFCWGHDGFQQNFYFCQQVRICSSIDVRSMKDIVLGTSFPSHVFLFIVAANLYAKSQMPFSSSVKCDKKSPLYRCS